MPMTVERMEAVEGLHKTIDRQDALIRQLGEALNTAHHAIHFKREVSNAEYTKIATANECYRVWKAGQP